MIIIIIINIIIIIIIIIIIFIICFAFNPCLIYPYIFFFMPQVKDH